MWSALRDNTGNFDFVKILTSKTESETKEQRTVRHKLEAQFFGEAMISIYGRKESRKWCADNKGKRFLQRVTSSCRAYCKLLMADRSTVYEEEWEKIDSLKGDDIMLYKQFKRSGKCVKKEDKDR